MSQSEQVSGNKKRKIRSTTRLYAIQALFQMEQLGLSTDEVVEEFVVHRCGEEHEEGHDDHGGLILANYLQKDAELDGYEIEFGNSMDLGSGELTLSFGRDEISGEFSGGGNIPRLNPARNIFKLKYSQDNTIFGLMFKDVEKKMI